MEDSYRGMVEPYYGMPGPFLSPEGLFRRTNRSFRGMSRPLRGMEGLLRGTAQPSDRMAGLVRFRDISEIAYGVFPLHAVRPPLSRPSRKMAPAAQTPALPTVTSST